MASYQFTVTVTDGRAPEDDGASAQDTAEELWRALIEYGAKHLRDEWYDDVAVDITTPAPV